MSRRDRSRRGPLGLVSPGVAAAAIVIGLAMANLPLLGGAGRAATTHSRPAQPPAADAPGRWGCTQQPTPTPTPTPPRAAVEGLAGTAALAALQRQTALLAGADVGPSVTTRDVAPAGLAGIDISRYQLKVDLTAARAAGIRFVFTKATQGTTILDPWYVRHVQAARAANMLVGSYHFYDYRQDGVAQADWFVKAMRQAGAESNVLPPVVDVECLDSLGRADRPYVRAQLRAFVDRVYRRTGRIVMVYTSSSMWDKVTGGDATFGGHPLWVACWGCTTPRLPTGWSSWAFWQHGQRRLPDGRNVDGNVFVGSSAALTQLKSRPLAVAGGAATTRGGRIPFELRAVDGVSVRTSTRTSGGWGPWTDRGAAGSVSVTGSAGTRTVRVQGRDARGTTGRVMSDTIRLLAARTPSLSRARPSARVKVPKVRGLTPTRARAALRKAGLRVRTSVLRVTNRSVAKGRVVNTYPSYRSDGKARTLARGAMVRLKVSR